MKASRARVLCRGLVLVSFLAVGSLLSIPRASVAAPYRPGNALVQPIQSRVYRVSVARGRRNHVLQVMATQRLRARLLAEGFRGHRGDAAVEAFLAHLLQRRISMGALDPVKLGRRELTVDLPEDGGAPTGARRGG